LSAAFTEETAMPAAQRNRLYQRFVAGMPATVAFLGCVALGAEAASGAGIATPYDFDGDGRAELVAGLPRAFDAGRENAGAVIVVRSVQRRLRPAHRAVLAQSSPFVPDAAEDSDAFGEALASGDFNGDGYADLAVGSDEGVASDEANEGAVTVLEGGPRGLLHGGRAVQFLGDLETTSEGGEAFLDGTAFGSALAAGDLNADGMTDLVVGAPKEAPVPDSDQGQGAIHILFGSATGLSLASERVLARPRREDPLFGDVLAVGDVDRDGHVDIIEATAGSGDTFDDDLMPGRLSYCPGAGDGPTACRRIGLPTPRNLNVVGKAREGPASLAIGDITGDGYPDIVEGVPEERWHDGMEGGKAPAGAIFIRRGTPKGPSRKRIVITQNSAGVPGHSSPSDDFGRAVAVGRLDGDRYADIVVGAPHDSYLRVLPDERKSLSGRVTVVRGGPDGHRAKGNVSFDRTSRGMPRTALGFGSALSLLDFDGDLHLDLAAGAEGDVNAVDGRVIALMGSRRGLTLRRSASFSARDVRLGNGALGTVLGR
jgi:hypothetical protein